MTKLGSRPKGNAMHDWWAELDEKVLACLQGKQPTCPRTSRGGWACRRAGRSLCFAGWPGREESASVSSRYSSPRMPHRGSLHGEGSGSVKDGDESPRENGAQSPAPRAASSGPSRWPRPGKGPMRLYCERGTRQG